MLPNKQSYVELCRSKLVSILSTHMFRKYQGFIEKVGEIRFNKVKQRHVNKLRKEGNITGVSTQLMAFSSSQAGRQAGPPWDSTASQEASAVSPNIPPSWENLFQEGSSWDSSQAGRQAPTFPGTVLLPRQSVQFLLTALLPRKIFPRKETV